MFEIQTGEEEYRIVSSDGQEGTLVAYGEVSAIKVGNDIYYACVDDADAEAADVCRVDSVSIVKSEMIETEFEEDEEEDEEEEVEEVEVPKD